MQIKDILIEKRRQIQSSGNPCVVQFTVEEINTLADINALRCLKLQEPFPHGYKPAEDPFTCVHAVINGDSIYRVLEFCLLKNRALKHSIPVVFDAWR